MADILSSFHPSLWATANSMKWEIRKLNLSAHLRTASCISTGIFTRLYFRVGPPGNRGRLLVGLLDFAAGLFDRTFKLCEDRFDFFSV